MIPFVPKADTFSGRVLARLGRLLGLRSETVYSRAFLLLTLFLILVGVGVSYGVLYLLQNQFAEEANRENEALKASVEKFLWTYGKFETGGEPDAQTLDEISVLLGKKVHFQGLEGEGSSEDRSILIPWLNEQGAQVGTILIDGRDPLNRAGAIAARLFIFGLASAGLVTMVLIFMVMDRTVLSRLHLLMEKLEFEKKSERLPVKLDFPGEDELAVLASSIEELAVLVQAGEREFRNVVEDQTDGICRFDRLFRIIVHNQAFESICQKVPKGMRPAMEDSLNVETFELVRNAYARLTPMSPVATITHPITVSGGMVAWYRSTMRANFDESSGEATGGQWISVDVTSEVVARRKLLESQKELQALSGRLMNLQDEERRRIARDLHDSTAQSLSALEMNTSLLETRARSADTRKLAGETRVIAQQVCQELRNLSYLLHPPLLEERGLVFALQWFIEGFTSRNGMPVALDISPEFSRLDIAYETALFRIVQEAMNNIYRHSAATKVWIVLQIEEKGSVFMEVRDNGRGFPSDELPLKASGVGLAGMRERMNHLGGVLEVDSSPYGVSIKCRLPIVVYAQES